MLKKYKIQQHVHDEHCGHDHHHHHEHGEHCSHDHHHHHEHGEHCSHDHHHHEHDSHSEVQELFEQGKISDVQKQLAQHGHDHSYDLALCDWELTKSNGSLEALQKKTSAFPATSSESAIAHLNLGLIYKERSQQNDAKVMFEKVIQISKSSGSSQDERSFAEAELAKIQTGSLKDKLMSFFK